MYGTLCVCVCVMFCLCACVGPIVFVCVGADVCVCATLIHACVLFLGGSKMC